MKELKPTDINTSYPGFIYNFNPTDQTADVQLAIETSIIGLDGGFQLRQKQILRKVPVQFVRGGGWSLTFPVQDKTPCFVSFAQRGIDHWLVEGKENAGLLNGKPAPQFGQFFSLNNAVAHIGINPVTQSIGSFSMDGAELRNAEHDQVIALRNDGTISIETGSSILVISKDGNITATTTAQAVIKADGGIKLDGDVTATKTLTVAGESNLNGGVNAKGGSGEASLNITGKMKITGPINNVQIESHQHPYDWTDGAGSSSTEQPTKV